MKVEAIVTLLSTAAADPKRLTSAVVVLQHAVWRGEVEGPKEAIGVLRDLAVNLDYYEPDAARRGEDRTFFGEEIALAAVRIALAEIGRVMNLATE